ncbi:unnamed protein product [Rotaria socialis]|uniref:DHHA2 domain-containing protein n=1 Tax=Rotaria socialis TaxID=392032 RepID=A0A820TUC8_9BILA|nr:unnamed protein product [Rotaria socialis]
MIGWYVLSVVAIIQLHRSSIAVNAIPIASQVRGSNEVAVFGHLNPDTDSIATAIGYAALLRSMGINAKAYRLGDLNKETEFVLNTAQVQSPDVLSEDIPDGSEVVLVDHNERLQSIHNLASMNITYVIDHHKLGDLTTSQPGYIRFEPVGCTATIRAKISVTTTNDDRNIVTYLQPISGITDLQSYVDNLFEAKSDLAGLTTEEIVLRDYKIFVFQNQKWGIGVAETWYPDYLLNQKDELLLEMVKEKGRSNLTGILFSIIDILNEKNLMLIPGEPENTVVRAAFNVDVTDQMADLGARLSRKLQIIPPLEVYFNKRA